MKILFIGVVFFLCATHSLPASAVNEIALTGPVEIIRGDENYLEKLSVYIHIHDYTGKVQMREQASYKCNPPRASYEHFLPLKHINKMIRIRSIHKKYAQTNQIEVTPTESDTYQNPIELKQKKYIAEDYVLEVDQLREEKSKESLDKALMRLDEALTVYPSPTIYLEKVKTIDFALKRDIELNEDIGLFTTRLLSDQNFKELPSKFRYDLLIGLGDIYNSKTLSVESENEKNRYYELAIQAYDYAIELASMNAKAFQHKYDFQRAAGNYWDMVNTIKTYFEKNPTVKTQSTLRGFASEWLTGIEVISMKREYLNENEYVKAMKRDEILMSEWKALGDVLIRHKRYLLGEQAKRLKEAIELWMQIKENNNP